MEINAYRLSSFAETPMGGNPAGVVLNAEHLTEKQMQTVAAQIGYSETAFVCKSDRADFRVRFFTPNAEVDLCGHATIAVFSLLKQKQLITEGSYTQETLAGILQLSVMSDAIYMQQAVPQFFEILHPDELCDCLGLSESEFAAGIPIQAVSTGLKDILVPVDNVDGLRKIQPDMRKIEAISKKYNCTGLHVFSIEEDQKINAVCRNFAPLYGIPEESATGTSNGALAAYLYKYQQISSNTDQLAFSQGLFMNQPSIIKARLKLKENVLEEVWVGGEAVYLGENRYNI